MLVKDINPRCSETGIFWTNKVNITIAGVLVPRIVKPSTDMWNIMWYKRDPIFLEEDIQLPCRPHFYQTWSAWSMDQGSNENHSPVNNFVPTVTKFCVLWEGQALPHDTKFGNCRDKIVDIRAFLIWSLIHGSSWSGLIKLGPEDRCQLNPEAGVDMRETGKL